VSSLRWPLSGAAAFIIYALLSLWFFSPIPNLRGAYAGGGPDPFIFVWDLHWWPWAVAHGMNPFVTKFIWYPEEVNLTWVVSVPAVASCLPICWIYLTDWVRGAVGYGTEVSYVVHKQPHSFGLSLAVPYDDNRSVRVNIVAARNL
jgi:hypothetical protein